MSGLKQQCNQLSTDVAPLARSIVLGLLVMLGTALPSASFADDDKRSRSDAVEIAKQRSGGDGRVLSVKKQKGDNGDTVYAVKILNNGRVKVYTISETP